LTARLSELQFEQPTSSICARPGGIPGEEPLDLHLPDSLAELNRRSYAALWPELLQRVPLNGPSFGGRIYRFRTHDPI
jgi:hypothetical protein